MDLPAILRLLPHRFPFVLVDRVLELEPGVRAVAIKNVAANEPWFAGHFPQRPIMPGVLISEAFAQVAAIVALSEHADHAGREVYLVGLDKMRFRRMVTPGDQLRIEVEQTEVRRRIWTFSCVATVDGKKVADGRLLATVPPNDASGEPA